MSPLGLEGEQFPVEIPETFRVFNLGKSCQFVIIVDGLTPVAWHPRSDQKWGILNSDDAATPIPIRPYFLVFAPVSGLISAMAEILRP